MNRRGNTRRSASVGSVVVGGIAISPSLLALNPHLLGDAAPRAKGRTPLAPEATSVRVERDAATGTVTMYLDGLRLTSHTNSRAHWSKGCSAAKRQRAMVAQAAAMLGVPVSLPCVVTIIRCGGRERDSDNRDESGKQVRDAVALWLAPKRRADGVVVGDDGPTSPIVWRYVDEPGGPWGVRVVIERQETTEASE